MGKEIPIDMLNDALREIVFRRKKGRLCKKLANQTHYNVREVEALLLIHRKINSDVGPLSRLNTRDLLHSGFDYTENVRHLLVDRVFSAFDKRNTLTINEKQWIRGLSVYLRGNIEEKINFAYGVYDLMKSHKLKKEQIFPMLRGCMIRLQNEEDPDETVRDMIELMLKKIDLDRDGAITVPEFDAVVREKSKLFLECMGPVFPSREFRHAFLTTFTDRIAKY